MFTGRIYGAGAAAFRTNISAGEHFVRITGIKPIGITDSGFIVAERLPGTPRKGPVDVTIRQAQTGLLRAGAFISMLSLAALAALVAWPVCAWLRPRLEPVPLLPSDASKPDDCDSPNRRFCPRLNAVRREIRSRELRTGNGSGAAPAGTMTRCASVTAGLPTMPTR